MSLNPVEAPQKHVQTLDLPDIDPALIEQIDAAPPCEFAEIFSYNNKRPGECIECATWIITFRTVCGHGGELPGPVVVLLCNRHKGWLAGGDYKCGACGCQIAKYGISHLVQSMEPLK